MTELEKKYLIEYLNRIWGYTNKAADIPVKPMHNYTSDDIVEFRTYNDMIRSTIDELVDVLQLKEVDND